LHIIIVCTSAFERDKLFDTRYLNPGKFTLSVTKLFYDLGANLKPLEDRREEALDKATGGAANDVGRLADAAIDAGRLEGSGIAAGASTEETAGA